MRLSPGVAIISCLAVVFLTAACGQGQPSGKVAPSATPNSTGIESSSSVQRGENLYQANCLSCHGGATGGNMMDIPPPHNASGHTWHHSDCQLTEIVLNGSGEMGEMMRQMMNVPESAPRMLAFRGKLTEEDIAAILAYIKTWWTEEQQRSQAEVTRSQC